MTRTTEARETTLESMLEKIEELTALAHAAGRPLHYDRFLRPLYTAVMADLKASQRGESR